MQLLSHFSKCGNLLIPIPDEEEDIQEQEEQHNTQEKAQEEASISLDPTPELEYKCLIFWIVMLYLSP